MRNLFLCTLLWGTIAAGALYAQVSRTIYRYGISMQDVAWSPDGSRLAFIGGSQLIAWDVAADTIIGIMQSPAGQINALRWRPDGKEIAYGSGMIVGVWNPYFGTHRSMTVKYSPVKAVSWSPDGSKIACASGSGNTMENMIWDVGEAKILSVIDQSDMGYGCSVHQALWHPDGSQIIFAGSCGFYADICDPQTGRIIGHLDPWFGNSASYATIRSLSYSPDGRYLAAGHYWEYINIFDSKTGKNHRVINMDGDEHTSGQIVVAWNPAGNLLVSGRNSGQIVVWNPTSGEKINAFPGHDGAITGLSWSPDGRRLASSGADGTVKIWEGTTLLSAVEDISSQAGELQVYPNPARNGMQVEYSCSHAGTVALSLVDVRGVAALAEEYRSSGTGRQELHVDLSGVATGPYILLLRLPDGRSQRRKVEVVK